MSLLKQNPGFLLGVAAAILVILLPTPDGLSPEAHKTAALFLFMGVWSATEAVPFAGTA